MAEILTSRFDADHTYVWQTDGHTKITNVNSRHAYTTHAGKPTFVEKPIDSSKPGIVGLASIGVELQYEAALWRVVLGLRQAWAVATQREAWYTLLGHLRSLQIHVKVHVISTPVNMRAHLTWSTTTRAAQNLIELFKMYKGFTRRDIGFKC